MGSGTRQLVRHRADERCEYCRLPDKADEWPFHVDHIVAVVHGGSDQLSNLCWSCTQCNLHKGTNLASIDPATGQQTNIFHPRQDLWADHFKLEADGRIIGLTAMGRVTVRLLDMNGTPQPDLRRELLHQGDFSP